MDQLKALIPVAPEDTVFTDSEGIVVYISKSLEGFFSKRCIDIIAPDRVIGCSYIALWEAILSYSQKRDTVLEHLRRLIGLQAGNLLIEVKGCEKERPRDIFLNILRIPQSKDYLPIQHIDVTDYLMGETTLRRRLKKLQHIINNQPEFVCLMRPDRRLTFANDPLCAHLAAAYEEVIEQPFERLLPNNSIREEFLDKMGNRKIEIAHNLVLKVIVEGVEHLEQTRFLGDLKCDELQGYFFSRPLPAHEFRRLLENMKIL